MRIILIEVAMLVQRNIYRLLFIGMGFADGTAADLFRYNFLPVWCNDNDWLFKQTKTNIVNMAEQ